MLCVLAIRFSVFHRWSFLMKHIVAAVLVSIAIASPLSAQRLVDPTKVAPEYREAAEKRRAEQIRQQECAHKADAEKVIARERTAFLIQCLESDAGK
jgi:hypothetical protein